MRSQSKSLTLLCVFVTLFVLTSADFEDIVTNIDSVSTLIDQVDQRVSLQGGAYLYIKGSGFSTRSALSNRVTLDDDDCPVIGFLTTSTQVVCQVPPASQPKKVQVRVYVDNLRLGTCGGCTLTYLYSLTPQLQYLLPNAANPGDEINYYGIQRVSSSTDVDYVKIGNDRCNPSDQNEFDAVSFDPYNNQQAPCNVPNIEAGYYPVTQRNLQNTGFATVLNTVHTYKIASNTSYDFAVIPKITAISSNKGSSQGQIITVKGSGFSSTGKNQVNLVDTNCTIISQSVSQIQCEVQPRDASLNDTSYQAGLKFELYYGKDISTVKAGTAGTPNATYPRLVSEVENTLGTYFSSKLSGYFKAPVTGNYKFMVSADDKAQLFISQVPNIRTNLSLLIDVASAGAYKFFWNDGGSTLISNDTALIAGNYYYMEVYHQNYGGPGYATIGVQVPNTPNNVNTRPEVQAIKINCPSDYEVLTFQVSNVNGGKWRASFIYLTSDGKKIDHTAVTAYIAYNAGPSVVAGAITSATAFPTSATVKMLTASGATTLTAAQATTFIYSVTFLNFRTNGRLPTIDATLLTGSSVQVSVIQTQAPSDPLTGSFNITRGTQSVKVNYDTYGNALQNLLQQIGFSDPIRVVTTGYSGLGYQWRIEFKGDGAAPIDPLSITNNLAGCKANSKITIDVATIQDSSNDLFYEVIPSELLFSAEQSPQVTVTSNGVLANCPGYNCNYLVQDAGVPVIATSVYASPALTLTIASVTKGAYNANSIRVFFGNTECQVTSYVDTVIPATLISNCPNPEGGDFFPRVHFLGLGYAKNDANLVKVTVPVSVSAVSPTQINPYGGTVLTVTGKGFPVSLAAAQTRGLTLQVGTSSCTLNSITPTQIQCTTSSVTSLGPLNIALNSKTAASSALTLMTTYPKITVVTPKIVNPVLQSDVTITGTNFDTDIAQTHVYIKNNTVAQVSECLVATSTATQITCTLLGAPTGTYSLYVQTSNGYSDSVPFNVHTAITSVTPSKGSTEGGTLLTIQGSIFGAVQQTLVFIGDDNVPCDVVSTTSTQVQCLTRAKSPTYNSDPQAVHVDTRIVEEAICENGGTTCSFAYSNDWTPIVTGISAIIKNAGDVFQLSGTGFDNAGSDPIVTLDGKSCLVSTVTATSLTVIIPQDATPNPAAVLAINVAGKGNARFTGVNNTIEVTPSLTSVSPTTGSNNGVLITLTGTGFQSGLTVKVGSSTCAIRSFTATSITCKAILQGNVTINYGNYSIGCDTCSLGLTAPQTPTVTSVSPLAPASASSFTLTIVGTKLNLGTVSVILYAKADSTVQVVGTVGSTTATQTTAVFTNVPAGTYTVEVASGANLATYTSLVTVPLTASVGTAVSSSIAGGASFTVTGTGFFGNAQASNNKVTVCGLPCQVTQSTATSIQCQAPAFVSSTVESAYPSLVAASIMTGTTTSDAGNEVNAFDESFTTSYSSKQNACFIGLDVGAGLQGELREVNFFPNPQLTASTFNNTVIEGSNDGVNYVTITVLSANTHDGWNNIILDSQTWANNRYRYFKLRGASSGAKCAVAELQFYGVVLSSNTSPLSLIACTASVKVNDQVQTTTNTAVNYKQSLTANVSSISPKMGTSAGGTTLTITGAGFSTNVANVKVSIDGVNCPVSTATSTQITCVTGAAPSIEYRRPSLQSELKVQLLDSGFADTNGIKYFYIDKWSDVKTWGGITPPRLGESVSIPAGQTVLLDVSPPKLRAIIIEGALIFDDANINLDCDYIVIRNGRMQIGTWEQPIQNKITVTLHGTKDDPQLPVFGNKVIAMMEGILDIHGQPRSYTWTVLDQTADIGATSIVVQGAVDWAVGEQIVVASTEHDHYQSESRTIASVTPNSPSTNKTTITFTDPFVNRHYAGIQTIDGQTFEMRAEVGLLTRNVVIQGDESSVQNLYGVHIMSHSTTGDDSSIGRISYTEVRQAGQAYNLGRYPIHFHLIGNVRQSYVIGNAIHHTYNRAVTIHGVHFLKVQKNVAYWVMGHTIFIEDGIETHNVIEDNLVINTIASTALLNTDQTPASFWITNPNNIWRRNHAAGSDRYGFWFDLRAHPEGPSATDSICPTGERLGEFTDNQAHSSGRYGLRIFHELTPRTYPCLDILPYELNPPIQAEFTNFLGWKNMRNAIVAEKIGAVKFKNIKSADNLRSGIEISNGNLAPYGMTLVEDAWLVGTTPENAGDINLYIDRKVRGLITPKVDFFLARGVHFSNYGDSMTAIETCSHCEHPAATDAGARTAFFEKLSFNNVSQRVRYNIPFKEILVDNDGTLTDNTAGGKGVVTHFYNHLNVTGCKENYVVYDGLVCNEKITIRRIEFNSNLPWEAFLMEYMIIYNTQDNPLGLYGAIAYRTVQKSWAVPFVTGSTYNVSWASRADFDAVTILPSQVITDTDHAITLSFNHSEYRETYDIIGITDKKNITNSSALWNSFTADTKANGDWYHDANNRLLNIVIDGSNKQNLRVTSVKCRVNCPLIAAAVPKDGLVRVWSNATIWPNKKVPQDGDAVIIPGEWVIKLDVNTSSLNSLDIKGDLYFDSTKDNLVLTSKTVWVEGQLFIGNSTTDRYYNKATVLLTGIRSSPSLLLGGVQDASNKVLAVTGNVTMYGAQVNNVYTRLLAPAQAGAKTITVASNIDWVVGNEIFLAPSQRAIDEFESRTIVAISNGVLTLDKPLSFYHFGAATITKQTIAGTLDMRTEVGLLTRNIIVRGSDEDSWSGRIYVGEVYNTTNDFYLRGRVDLDGIQMSNLGQSNTTLAGLTFDTLVSANNDISTVRNCVSRDSLGIMFRIIASNGVTIENNAFYNGYRYMARLEGKITNFNFKNNLLVGNKDRGLKSDAGDMADDFIAAFYSSATFTNSNVTANIIGGFFNHGFVAKGDDCASANPTFTNNVAHSGIYAYLVDKSGADCTLISSFTGYKNYMSVISFFETPTIIGNNLILTDNEIGFSLNIGNIDADNNVVLRNSYVGGLALADVPSAYPLSDECSNLAGIYIPVSTIHAKGIPPSKSALPWFKIKSLHTYKSTFTVNNVVFENFKDGQVAGCSKNHIFESNHHASDSSATTQLSNVVLSNVGASNRVYFNPPQDAEVGLDNCGGWHCSGLKNILIRDLDGTLTGQPSSIFPTCPISQ